MRKFLVRQVRDDSPAQQRPKWVSAVKSPLRGGAPSTVVAWLDRCGDGAAISSLRWLAGLRRGTLDDVPLA